MSNEPKVVEIEAHITYEVQVVETEARITNEAKIASLKYHA